MDDVEYRLVDGYSGAYRVGSDGSVWSRKLMGPSRGLSDSWRLLKQKRRHGYLLVALSEFSVYRHIGVHRLVLTSFNGPCPEGHEARHLNGVRDDNRLDNLKWGTRQENVDDRRIHGTMPVGSSFTNKLFTEEKVSRARQMFLSGMSIRWIAKKIGHNELSTRDVIRGRRNIWSHVLPPPIPVPDSQRKPRRKSA